MPISHRYKMIFAHIPKTGGSSVNSILKVDDNDPTCYSSNERWVEWQGKRWAELHLPGKALKELCKEDVYDEYCKFTVIRNPYYRLLSAYFDKVKLECPYTIVFDNLNPNHFEEWVWNIKHGIIWNEHVELQKNYIEPDFQILRYDYLNKAWKEFAYHTEGLEPVLPRVNCSNIERPTSEYFCEIYPETIKMINEIYGEDFEFLKYRML